MRKIRLLADIHGEKGALKQATRGIQWPLIQLGDFGWGESLNYLYQHPNLDIRFIHGNHEKYSDLNKYKQYLGKFGILEDFPEIFFISGAWSIDKQVQMIHGVWGEEEELTYSELNEAIKLYEQVKPRIVLSHTAPSEIAMRLISPVFGGYYNNRTEEAFQWMFELHKPEMWFFAHWHKSYEIEHKGTIFRCLNINEWADVEIE